MVHLIDFQSYAVLLACLHEVADIQTETPEHTHDVLVVRHLLSIHPNICPIVNSVEGKPNLSPLEGARDHDLRAVPVRVLPWISAAFQIVIFRQIKPFVELVGHIRNKIIVQANPRVGIDAVLNQSVQDGSRNLCPEPSVGSEICLRYALAARLDLCGIDYLPILKLKPLRICENCGNEK